MIYKLRVSNRSNAKLLILVLIFSFFTCNTYANDSKVIHENVTWGSGLATVFSYPVIFLNGGVRYEKYNLRASVGFGGMAGVAGIEVLYTEIFETRYDLFAGYHVTGGGGDYNYEAASVGVEFGYDNKDRTFARIALGVYKKVPSYRSEGLSESYLDYPVPSLAIGYRY